jgi:murein DD-endopeptidase MepM/ murein hydrolase activator NlpD
LIRELWTPRGRRPQPTPPQRRIGQGGSMLIRALVAAGVMALASSAAPGPRSAAPPPAGAAGRGAAGAAYVAPASPLRVVRPFRRPVNRYAAGHRGVDLRIGPGLAVVSAGPGIVRFAGSVGGRGVIVVAHADGVSTEYEPVAPSVRVGVTVRAGQLIGHVRGTHTGCSGPCVHWGARRGDDYFDPLTLLEPLGPVVLLPWSTDG